MNKLGETGKVGLEEGKRRLSNINNLDLAITNALKSEKINIQQYGALITLYQNELATNIMRNDFNQVLKRIETSLFDVISDNKGGDMRKAA